MAWSPWDWPSDSSRGMALCETLRRRSAVGSSVSGRRPVPADLLLHANHSAPIWDHAFVGEILADGFHGRRPVFRSALYSTFKLSTVHHSVTSLGDCTELRVGVASWWSRRTKRFKSRWTRWRGRSVTPTPSRTERRIRCAVGENRDPCRGRRGCPAFEADSHQGERRDSRRRPASPFHRHSVPMALRCRGTLVQRPRGESTAAKLTTEQFTRLDPMLVALFPAFSSVCTCTHSSRNSKEAAARINGSAASRKVTSRSVLGRFSGWGHLDDARLESGEGLDEVGLRGHDVVDVLVDHRHFVESC